MKPLLHSQGRKEKERNPTCHSRENSAQRCWPQVEMFCPLLSPPSPMTLPPNSNPELWWSGGSPNDGAWLEKKAEQKGQKVERTTFLFLSSYRGLLTLQHVLCDGSLTEALAFQIVLDHMVTGFFLFPLLSGTSLYWSSLQIGYFLTRKKKKKRLFRLWN